MDESSLCVVQDENYKYVHFAALPPLFFDLAKDPDQFVNLAEDPAYAALVRDYAQKALSWRLTHADRTLTHFRSGPQRARMSAIPTPPKPETRHGRFPHASQRNSARRFSPPPAALRDRSGRQPAEHHHRGAEDRQHQHARRAARAVQCRRARLLLVAVGGADRQELARQSGDRAGPRHRVEAHRRSHGRAEAAPGREVP